MGKYQRALAAAFIRNGNRVLIAKRSMDCKIFPGLYELPGGKIEFGETPEEALKREIKEELNVNIRVLEPFFCYSYVTHEGKAHYVETVFICELEEDKGNIKMLEHDDIRWVTREELESYNMGPRTKNAARRGFDVISRANQPS